MFSSTDEHKGKTCNLKLTPLNHVYNVWSFVSEPMFNVCMTFSIQAHSCLTNGRNGLLILHAHVFRFLCYTMDVARKLIQLALKPAKSWLNIWIWIHSLSKQDTVQTGENCCDTATTHSVAVRYKQANQYSRFYRLPGGKKNVS